MSGRAGLIIGSACGGLLLTAWLVSYYALRDFRHFPDWQCHEFWIGPEAENQGQWCTLRFFDAEQEQRWLQVSDTTFERRGDWYHRSDNVGWYTIYQPLTRIESFLRRPRGE